VRHEGEVTGCVPEEAAGKSVADWPHANPSRQINADTENGCEQEQTERTENPDSEAQLRFLCFLLFKNPASASIRVICGQMPFPRFLLAKIIRPISRFGIATEKSAAIFSSHWHRIQAPFNAILTKLVIFVAPLNSVSLSLLRLFATILRKCLTINYLQQISRLSSQGQSSPVAPNRAKLTRKMTALAELTLYLTT
jgi:hypothetical protein